MAGSSLLTLIDDIATLLDDVALMSKVAARKTAGVLGDDLALNAEQVSGVRAERELPVVWAVGKGSMKNKCILVPAALAISAFIPWLIIPLLMCGGAFLCYEGFEKIVHKLLHGADEIESQHKKMVDAVSDPKVDMVAFEKKKINGAIRTDFILSAEIIVIALGTVKDASFAVQVGVVAAIAVLVTIVVYGLVAGIVKLDDVGLYLIKDKASNLWGGLKRFIGKGLLVFAPFLMKSLSIVGTVAMFLVGGGILLHGIPESHHWLESITESVSSLSVMGDTLAILTPTIVNGLAGLIVGGILVAGFSLGTTIISKFQGANE